MKGGIASRLAIIFSLLVLVATATVGFLVFWEARQSLIDSSSARLRHTAETVKVRFFASLEAIGNDALFLAETPPVAGIMRARAYGPVKDGTYIDKDTNISEEEWRDLLADIFDVFLQNRPSYFQVRFVGLAENGEELVRVERRDGLPYRNKQLQQIGDRAYFTEALNLRRDDKDPVDIYFSEIDLDQEEGGSTMRGVPALRTAVPVHDAGGNPFGILVINVDFRHVLKTLQALVEKDVSLYLANNKGYYLIHPDSLRVSGPKGRHLMQRDFPGLEKWFDEPQQYRRTEPETNKATPPYFYPERIPFDDDAEPPYLVLGVTSPRETILAGVTKVRNRSALITLLFCLWGIALALFVSRYLTRPLRQITQALSRFGSDEQPIQLPVRRKDEIGVLARAYDTMARQIQAQIQELEDKALRQRIILETSAEGIIVTNAQGQIETFNRAAERIFGYTAEEVTGRHVNMLVYADAREPHGDGQAPAEETEQWRTLGNGHEVTGRHKDGATFPLSLALSSFELAGELKYAGFLQDITRRKEYEQTLRQAKLTAEAANTAKSAFLANMSHEIRTPLTGIIGFASLLAKQVSGKHRKYAQLIEGSGIRLKETLNSVLDLAKLEAKRVEIELGILRVRDEVQEVVQLFQAQAQQKGLSFAFEVVLGAEQASARLDRGALSSILHNLVGNAIKFTEQGGITIRIEADDDHVYVRVKDTGVGIEPAFMPHLFDVFRQESTGLSRTHEGSGLGLSITQRLVELMDGEISVASEKGQGSTFTVSFPQVEGKKEAGMLEARLPALAMTDQAKSRILLVEDNENTCYLIESLLEDEFSVTVVTNAEEALLAAFRNEFDIVLLDINLGEGPNGADVLRELRAMPAYRDVSIVALTAYALPGDRERFLEMGFTAYLSKPFNADELLALTARL